MWSCVMKNISNKRKKSVYDYGVISAITILWISKKFAKKLRFAEIRKNNRKFPKWSKLVKLTELPKLVKFAELPELPKFC